MNQKVMQTMLFPCKYIQGNGAIKQLPAEMARFGDRPLVLSTKSMVETARGIIGSEGKVEQFNGECSEKEITRVVDLARIYNATAIAAMGGGNRCRSSSVL